ncbi:MAG: hypothetical protein O3A01_05950 [bacterium]|nr:hypothetical protein [bacterium]
MKIYISICFRRVALLSADYSDIEDPEARAHLIGLRNAIVEEWKLKDDLHAHGQSTQLGNSGPICQFYAREVQQSERRHLAKAIALYNGIAPEANKMPSYLKKVPEWPPTAFPKLQAVIAALDTHYLSQHSRSDTPAFTKQKLRELMAAYPAISRDRAQLCPDRKTRRDIDKVLFRIADALVKLKPLMDLIRNEFKRTTFPAMGTKTSVRESAATDPSPFIGSPRMSRGSRMTRLNRIHVQPNTVFGLDKNFPTLTEEGGVATTLAMLETALKNEDFRSTYEERNAYLFEMGRRSLAEIDPVVILYEQFFAKDAVNKDVLQQYAQFVFDYWDLLQCQTLDMARDAAAIQLLRENITDRDALVVEYHALKTWEARHNIIPTPAWNAPYDCLYDRVEVLDNYMCVLPNPNTQ